MSYEVKLTEQAIIQMQDVIEYISHILLVPETARQWSNYLKNKISQLDFMPYRYPLLELSPWKEYGYHKMNVKNFVVYYWVDEENKIVWVTAVVYSKRDQLFALKDMQH